MCPKRCGGQGDILSGILSVFQFWCSRTMVLNESDLNRCLVATFLATNFTKYLAFYTFKEKGISMTASDMIANIPDVLKCLLSFSKDKCE